MHVFMQMHKYSNIIVEGADCSFIILRFLSTGTILFIIIIIYFFLSLFFENIYLIQECIYRYFILS